MRGTSGTRKRVAPGRMLVVEDDDGFYRCLERIVSRYRPLRHARTFEAARAELEARKDWCGFVFDVNLDERARAGLELAEMAAERFPGVPAMVMTGFIDGATVNRATALGAYVLTKPAGEAELMPFLQRVIAREHGFLKDFSDRLDALTRSWRLSPREHEIVAWFVAGRTREEYLDFSGVADSTLKTHVKHIIEKTACESLGDVVASALRLVIVPPDRARER